MGFWQVFSLNNKCGTFWTFWGINCWFPRLTTTTERKRSHTDNKQSRKERNVLFNDALNTFYLWLYSISNKAKNHLDGEWERKPAAVTTCDTLSDMHHPFDTPIMEHWLEWEIAQWVHEEGLIRWPITTWADALPQNYYNPGAYSFAIMGHKYNWSYGNYY